MVIPIQSRIRDTSLIKAGTAAPLASTDPAQVCFSWDGSSFDSSPLSNPSAPPPTPSDSLLDIHPRKSSFSSELGMGAACAFPSWPNRPSLSSTDSSDSYVSSYISDEELLCLPEPADVHQEKTLPRDIPIASSMTLEQQLQCIRAQAEEEDRARFQAKLEAHARATQALRLTKVALIHEREAAAKRKKRRIIPDRRRRAHSA